ncbi:hypothetical protein NUW58_g10006 [Xylaria curta]|uniref:Uncharacterized protein n=1 Tax=Xylaria curta TaxID=42375 RepID=A0ACC1MT36_9PEZI|nr:hypothetical protein NUW58_g10006 [Xylaria curta]
MGALIVGMIVAVLCLTYVRDTKLERTNHEATAKHQSGLKRFLRDLHRGHENELREKDRAKREIDRLNGITAKPSGSSSSSTAAATTATVAQRQQQWEQLAEMGISVPTELRRDMALAGEWTVTNTRVINDTPAVDDTGADSKPAKADAVATDVRKRPKKEEEDDEDREEENVQGLFKKPRRWGRDTKHAAADDAELDALLSTSLTKPLKKEEDDVKQPVVKADSPHNIKKEEAETDELLTSTTEPVANEQSIGPAVKKEHDTTPSEPVVLFKKRKPKNIRQK